VVGPLPGELLGVFEERAARLPTSLHVLGRQATVRTTLVECGGTTFTYCSPAFPEGIALHTPLVGEHQAVNAGIAVLAVERMGEPPGPDTVREGVESTRWPGRFQVLELPEGTWILDLAHNAAAATALSQVLAALPVRRPLVVLVAILGDKPWREMLHPLLGTGAHGVFTVAPSSPERRRWDPAVARIAVPDHPVAVVPDFDMALRRAREIAGRGTVVVTGSCFTVGDALRRLAPGLSA
jgi:folylpolyglutamate synthase/dihydropteroate synthase